MDTIEALNSCYDDFSSHPAPDGILTVDIRLLLKYGLLGSSESSSQRAQLTRHFHVVDADDRVTLFNSQHVVWIVPQKRDETPITQVLIAINDTERVHLEIVFEASGVYNTSRTILQVLEALLAEIDENEAYISTLEMSAD